MGGVSKLRTQQKIGLGLAALVGLCCAGSTIAYSVSGDGKTKPTAVSTAGTPTAQTQQLVDTGTPTPDPGVSTSLADPTTAAPQPTAPSVKPAPAKTTATPRPKTTTSKPKPKPTTAKPKPPALPVVHPGAFCKTQGARGVTKTGKPMICTTTATDPKKRWRAA